MRFDNRSRLIGLLRAGFGSLCAVALWSTPACADVGGFQRTFDQLDRSWQLGAAALAGGVIVLLLTSVVAVLCVRRSRSTEREFRANTAALARQNAQFKAALDNMRLGLTMFDADGVLEVFNDRVLEAYGLPAECIRTGITASTLTAAWQKHGKKAVSESGQVVQDIFERQPDTAGRGAETSLWDEDERNVVIDDRIIRVTRTIRDGGGYIVTHADITEHQRALANLELRENELTEQIERFKDLVEGIPYGLSMFDADRRLIVCNRPYADIYSLEEANTRPGTPFNAIVDNIFARHVLSDSSRAAREAYRRAVNLSTSSSRVATFSDGRSILMSRYPRPGGGWVAIHEDVTARVRVERELEASRTELAVEIERFKDALDNMGQGISMYDADERLVVYNRHFLEINKLSERDVKPGTVLRDVVHKLVENRVYDLDLNDGLQRYLNAAQPNSGFTDIRHQADGRAIQISSYPRSTGGFVVIHHDVTEREQARRELELSEAAQRLQSELFKDALDNMGYGLNVFDAKARMLIYNKQYLDMVGLTEADIPIGASARQIIDIRQAKGTISETSETFFTRYGDAIKSKQKFEHVETDLRGKVISSAFFPRSVGGWIVLHSDITERVRAEESERRAAQESEELRRQRHAALAANQAKSAFLAMMSHEIRTPMNAVIGLSAALLDSDLGGEQRHLVDTIHESSNSLLRLLNDILDISKLDAGKVQFEEAPFSPAALIDNAVSIVEARAAEKGLKMRARAIGELPLALIGDHSRLRQVILNLATNAIKFTEAGGVEITARCISETDTAATIEFRVNDTGIGIAPDVIEKLFQEFTQADASISRKFGGTGLGLAISKRIVDQMGGTIRAESVLSEGASFIFEVPLPKTDASALADNRGRSTESAFAKILANLSQPLQVMLAEDNATNQLVFSKLVQNLKFDLTIANNGREALDYATERTFDVVFMDIRMPEMDGLTACREIRALGGAWTNVPIIALTANAFSDDVKACRDAGMNEFMSKPIRKKVLFEKLSLLLSDHPSVAEQIEAQAGAPEESAAENLPVTPPAEVALTDVGTILDRRTFEELVDAIGREGVRAIMDVYTAETVARIDLLRSFSCDRDRARIKDEAHTLKGASGTFGLRQVSDLARTLEYSAHTIAETEYYNVVERLDACFQRGRDEAERVYLTLSERA
jgi:signal transduction histidine kinase/DNA-binding NarL/FixJ family response regulator/HPt (histidine-containing phosphotransfer) domain-containing protein